MRTIAAEPFGFGSTGGLPLSGPHLRGKDNSDKQCGEDGEGSAHGPTQPLSRTGVNTMRALDAAKRGNPPCGAAEGVDSRALRAN